MPLRAAKESGARRPVRWLGFMRVGRAPLGTLRAPGRGGLALEVTARCGSRE